MDAVRGKLLPVYALTHAAFAAASLSPLPFPHFPWLLSARATPQRQIKSTVNGFFSDQMRAIWNTWLVIQVLLFCFTVSSIAAASDTSA